VTDPLTARAFLQGVDALTLAVTSGLDAEQRVREVIGHPVEESTDDFDTAMDKGWLGAPNRVPIQFDSAPGGSILIEPNGYLMSAYAAEMTRSGGDLVSVYWQDATGRDTVTFARDGRLIRVFETYAREDAEGTPQPEEDGLPWDTDPRGAMVALVERIALRRVTEDWLEHTARRTWMVVEPSRT